MGKKLIAKCACGWAGECEGGTKIVDYFCPECGTGKYLVSIGFYYPETDYAELERLLQAHQTRANTPTKPMKGD